MGEAKKHLDELLKLPSSERSEAAEALLVSLETEPIDEDALEAWEAEIRRRIEADAAGVPSDVVFAEGRARLKRP